MQSSEMVVLHEKKALFYGFPLLNSGIIGSKMIVGHKACPVRVKNFMKEVKE